MHVRQFYPYCAHVQNIILRQVQLTDSNISLTFKSSIYTNRVYTHTHTHTQTHIHTHIHINTDTHTHTRTHIHTHTDTHTHTHTHTNEKKHSPNQIYVNKQALTKILKNIYAYLLIYVEIYPSANITDVKIVCRLLWTKTHSWHIRLCINI